LLNPGSAAVEKIISPGGKTMIATMEKKTVDPVTATDPTITYDLPTRKISVTVIVSWSDQLDQLVVEAPPLSVPGSGTTGEPATWTVLWTLQPDSTLESASFENIELPAQSSEMPPGVSVLMSEQGTSPAEWQVTIENSVANAGRFSYNLHITYKPTGGILGSLTHDPTIAVVPEPIG
jgi:hypothetical protein